MPKCKCPRSSGESFRAEQALIFERKDIVRRTWLRKLLFGSLLLLEGAFWGQGFEPGHPSGGLLKILRLMDTRIAASPDRDGNSSTLYFLFLGCCKASIHRFPYKFLYKAMSGDQN